METAVERLVETALFQATTLLMVGDKLSMEEMALFQSTTLFTDVVRVNPIAIVIG